MLPGQHRSKKADAVEGERRAFDASRNDWRLAAERAEDSRYHPAQLRISGPPQGHSLGCLLMHGPELFATQGKLCQVSCSFLLGFILSTPLRRPLAGTSRSFAASPRMGGRSSRASLGRSEYWTPPPKCGALTSGRQLQAGTRQNLAARKGVPWETVRTSASVSQRRVSPKSRRSSTVHANERRG